VPASRLARARRIGELSLRSGDFTFASQWLGRALDTEPDDAVTLAELAEARWRMGDTTAARTLIARATAADARDPRVQRVARIVR
jgi:Flp pilus assembly protein TadD